MPTVVEKRGFSFGTGLDRKWERETDESKIDRNELRSSDFCQRLPLEDETWFEHGNLCLPVTAIVEESASVPARLRQLPELGDA
jgi:hypothetical protein